MSARRLAAIHDEGGRAGGWDLARSTHLIAARRLAASAGPMDTGPAPVTFPAVGTGASTADLRLGGSLGRQGRGGKHDDDTGEVDAWLADGGWVARIERRPKANGGV